MVQMGPSSPPVPCILATTGACHWAVAPGSLATASPPLLQPQYLTQLRLEDTLHRDGWMVTRYQQIL